MNRALVPIVAVYDLTLGNAPLTRLMEIQFAFTTSSRMSGLSGSMRLRRDGQPVKRNAS
jgi:hypothetical protein